MKTVHESFDRLRTSFSRINEWKTRGASMRGFIRGWLSLRGSRNDPPPPTPPPTPPQQAGRGEEEESCLTLRCNVNHFADMVAGGESLRGRMHSAFEPRRLSLGVHAAGLH
jgi:hypothetical protein